MAPWYGSLSFCPVLFDDMTASAWCGWSTHYPASLCMMSWTAINDATPAGCGSLLQSMLLTMLPLFRSACYSPRPRHREAVLCIRSRVVLFSVAFMQLLMGRALARSEGRSARIDLAPEIRVRSLSRGSGDDTPPTQKAVGPVTVSCCALCGHMAVVMLDLERLRWPRRRTAVYSSGKFPTAARPCDTLLVEVDALNIGY